MPSTRLLSRLALLLPALSFLAAIAPATVSAQGSAGRIVGLITDRTAGAPVPNVSVTVNGTQLGGRTGADGRYTIGEVPAGTQRVKAARIGYAPFEQQVTITAGQTLTLNIALSAASVTLDQMVVVGYGAQRRSDLTGSVSSVTPNVDQTPTLSLEQALQGAAAGVSVTQASSAPGGALSIRVRGGSSVTGNNEPLYVIDGFPIENSPDLQSPSDGGRDASTTVPSNPLAALNPADIESIEILKDASATSIYGARGANGVIIITTKHGQTARPVFTLDTYSGSQSVAHRYKLLNSVDFAKFVNDWSVNNGTGVVFANPDTLPNTDWQSLIFRTAPTSNLQLGVTGGGAGANATHYALSGGVFQQQGVVINSAFKRISLRGNLDQNIGSKARVASTVMVSRVNTNSVPTDGSLNAGAGAVGAAIDYYPILPLRQPNGKYSLMVDNNPSSVLTPTNIPNPVSMAADVTDKLGDTRVLANAFGEYELMSGLKFRTSVGGDLSNRSRDTYYPITTLMGRQQSGYAKRGRTENTNFLNENTLSFDHTFNADNQINAVAGYSRQQNDLVASSIQNSNFVSDIDVFENIGAGTQTGGPQVTSGHTRWTLASYLGRLNYTLANRYLFTVTGREDGSSRFGADHQWGFFPSAAFGWRVSDEPFMQKFPAIELLKLRASTGLAGNPSIQPYQSMAHLLSQQYTFGGQVVPGYYPASVGNPNLGWETTRQNDVGVDLGLYGGRVTFTGDIYRKKTSDLLLAVNLPFESGFGTALQNVGAVSNNGFELGLTLTLLDGRTHPLGWTTTLNYSHNKNRVLDLGGVQSIFAGSVNSDLKLLGSLVQVGQALGVFYGYRTNGVLRDSAAAAAYTAKVKPLTGTWHAGDIMLVDVAGKPDAQGNATPPDGAITSDDRTIIGDPNPKFTAGWQNQFTFRRFRLSTLMDATYGNKILNLNDVRLIQGSPGTNIISDRYFDAWTASNTGADFPRINFTPGTTGSDITSDLLEDGSYLRLRSITLDVQIPERLLSRYGLTNTRLYATGTNLLTFTHYSGFNPDVSSLGIGNVNRGVDVGQYPLAKGVTIGVNIAY
jgi:TonB-dependent starch-binding outer membrane protein SusC